MPEDKPVVSEGAELSAAWADSEARDSIKRIARGMLLLALVLILGALLTPNPEVWYSIPGSRVGTSGWSGLIPPLPPESGFVGTVVNWVTFLMALLVTLTSALCRFLSVVPVVLKGSPVVDAILYGALAAGLLVRSSRIAAALLLLLAGAGLVISALRLTGSMGGESGNVIVSILATLAAARACQLTAACHRKSGTGSR